MQSELLARYEYVTTSRVRCRNCRAEMDVRGGRARVHMGVCGAPPPPGAVVVGGATVPPARAEPVGHERGSRQWAVEKVLASIEAKTATPGDVLKGLDLLKEYEEFGRGRVDEEREVEEHRRQWERVMGRVGGMREVEEKMVREGGVMERLRELMAVAGPPGAVDVAGGGGKGGA